MKGEVSVETSIEAPADVVWAAYRGKQLGLLMTKWKGDANGRIEFIEGDGGVGTVAKITFPQGTPGPRYFKEVFRVNDDEMRLKVTEVIEGGPKELGFELCRYKLQILEKDSVSSIVRSSVEYEFDDSLADQLAPHVKMCLNMLEATAQTFGAYLVETKHT